MNENRKRLRAWFEAEQENGDEYAGADNPPEDVEDADPEDRG